jgi:hypothetical protein
VSGDAADCRGVHRARRHRARAHGGVGVEEAGFRGIPIVEEGVDTLLVFRSRDPGGPPCNARCSAVRQRFRVGQAILQPPFQAAFSAMCGSSLR